jgi:single-stranded DNA-binding protein
MSIEAALFGVLGKDAETKTSAAGKPYLRLNIRTGDGDAAQWISAMCFDTDAIAQAERLHKGARVYIEGTIKLDEWTGQDGAKRHGLSLMSWHCRLSQIGRNRPSRAASAREDRPKAAGTGRARAAASDYAPIGAESRPQPPKGHPAFDDDIPF